MKILLLKQTDGFMLMTEDAWKSHLQMIRLNFMQEESVEDADFLTNDYADSFEKEFLAESKAEQYKKDFNILINDTRKIESYFGTIVRF